MSQAAKRNPHRKRHGHHQKRTHGFMKVYHPFMPLLLMITGSLVIFSALSGGKPAKVHRTDKAPVLSYATAISSQGLLNYTNQRRATANVGNLTISSKLNQAAQAKANDMASRNYWAHNTPDGTPPWTFITNAGYSYDKAGENLACGFDESNDVITGWYNSPSHRDNLLHPDYKEVGFGVVNADSYNCGDIPASQQTIIVAMYGTPYTPPSSTPAPTSTPKTTTSTKPAAVTAPVASPQSSPTTVSSHNLTLNVVDSDGKPAANIKVELHSDPKVGYTDKDGNIVFKDVETGKHTVILEIDGAKSETPIDLTNMSKDYKLSIVKPELTSNQTATDGEKAAIAKPQSVNRLQTLTDSYAMWIFGVLVFAVLLGAGYMLIKHSVAAHRFFIKGERYVLTHKAVDVFVVLLVIALYFLTRTVATIL